MIVLLVTNVLCPRVSNVLERSTSETPVISPLSAAFWISAIKYAVASSVERFFL